MFNTAIHGEELIREFSYKGITFELVKAPATIWCGTRGYGSKKGSEPDIPGLLEKYQKLCDIPKRERPAPDWSCCISIDYWRGGDALWGIMFAQQVLSDAQDSAHDVYNMPESLYIRAAGTRENAQAAFGRDSCELYELFGVIREAMEAIGLETGTNGAQEIEMYNHGAGLFYAYAQVQPR